MECTSYFLLCNCYNNITSLSLLIGRTVALPVFAIDRAHLSISDFIIRIKCFHFLGVTPFTFKTIPSLPMFAYTPDDFQFAVCIQNRQLHVESHNLHSATIPGYGIKRVKYSLHLVFVSINLFWHQSQISFH